MKLAQVQYDLLIDLARHALPHEACGLLAGGGEFAADVIPLTNVEHNPVGCGWRADSREQYGAFQRMAERGWNLLAIYHSHPTSPAYPSDHDIEHAAYPDARYVIISLMQPAHPEIRAFSIRDGHVVEESVVVGGG